MSQAQWDYLEENKQKIIDGEMFAWPIIKEDILSALGGDEDEDELDGPSFTNEEVVRILEIFRDNLPFDDLYIDLTECVSQFEEEIKIEENYLT